ncbi:MAG: hypothetical protein OXR62_11025 [Ahrensia sp.]|nr:hypothetical protein [Ahrensia sp.]
MSSSLMPCPLCGQALQGPLPMDQLADVFGNNAVKLNILTTLCIGGAQATPFEKLQRVVDRFARLVKPETQIRVADTVEQMNHSLAIAGWVIAREGDGFRLETVSGSTVRYWVKRAAS